MNNTKEYLKDLLEALWDQKEGFSGKRPFGNSGWELELYVRMIDDGLIEGTYDKYWNLQNFDKDKADQIIIDIIRNL